MTTNKFNQMSDMERKVHGIIIEINMYHFSLIRHFKISIHTFSINLARFESIVYLRGG